MPANRQDQRKARTRRALIDAAVRLTSSGRAGHASIQDITDEADLGFGTFYNHFTSKEELFSLASDEVQEQWGRELDAACEGVDDPAMAFTTKFRLAARAGRSHPDRARFLTELGLEALQRTDGLGPRARRDLGDAFAQGSLSHPHPPTALAAVAATLLRILEEQLANPDAVDDEVVDKVAESLLVMLGASHAAARALVAAPLSG